MLCRTPHNSFLFSFNAFSHSPCSSPSFSHPNLLPFSSSSSTLQGMDCTQGALTSCLGPETVVKGTPQVGFSEDFLAVNGGQSGGCGDDFFVDGLLDFSNGFSENEEEETEKPEKNEPEKQAGNDKIDAINSNVSSVKEDFGSLPCSELTVLAEDLENLEWLSHFVEESFSEYTLTGKLPPNPPPNRTEPDVSVQEKPRFTTPVQTKARTKRTRTGVRIWPLGSPEPSSSSSSSASSTTSFPAPNIYASPVQSQTAESLLGKFQVKKQKKKPTDLVVGGGGGAPRRCSHCGVTKTPQWRGGPLGAKTLCNACGVRYKSGRLLPEYRPACSPTFSTELHSNNHRKVLEMRQKKESLATAAAGTAPAVPTF